MPNIIKSLFQKMQKRIAALQSTQHHDATEAASKNPVFKGRLLVCEDDEISRQVIQTHLSKVGLEAETASNGKEGVLLVKARMDAGTPFDLIFMDMHMPELDGLEATEQLRRLGCKTPIVALTANITESDKERYRANGMTDCLGKPFKARELWDCMYQYLDTTPTV